eukprot:6491290-Amphidinium_carterae.2
MQDSGMLKKVVRYLGCIAIGWIRNERTDDCKLDLHLPGRSSLMEQPGGWNPLKGCWKDRPSLKAVKTAKQDEAEIAIFAYADSDWGTCEKSRRSYSGGVIMPMGAYVCG